MKERKKRGHAMVRKLFMLMAAFVLILCMKTTTYAASTKTVNMESVGSGMYIHIGTMKRGKGTVYHRVKVKKKGILIVAGAAIAEDERRMVWQFACVTVRNGLSSHIKEAMSARKSLSFTEWIRALIILR